MSAAARREDPRAWNRSGRLHGVDLARALAVLGMFAAHMLTVDDFSWSDPATWADVANGRSSILFAVLAGVSIALVSGGRRPVAGAALGLVRRRLAVRAGLLWLIGIALIITGVPLLIILPAYALLFLLALPLLRLGARALWGIAAALALVMPWVQPALDALPLWDGPAGEALDLALGWGYPFPLWTAFLVAGLAAGRSDLRAVRTQVALAAGGAAAAAIAYTVDAATRAAEDEGYLGLVWTAAAHSGGILEVVGSGGFALAVLGVCLLVCRTPLTWALLPLRAVGTMPLTAYVGQVYAWAIVAAATIGDVSDLGRFRDLEPFWPFALLTIAACTAWALLLGRGPMERLVAAGARLAVPGRV
ncbi:DUF418 domain-containing protein [uncultured Microbacterium sp.]|uniref:Acyltransferase n=1 Tax=uncultured Microbacterium sp. TaxID=191216 RepID=A0A1Y5P7T7_9MICO|nr:DUF418 domain-containing protein [uncultured Microbacterium sp.]SBS74772.1 Acyltransferase [uncultured Microbacterium sp.]